MQVRDAVEGDLEAIVGLFNALLRTTTVEWCEEPHTLEGRRAWWAAHRAAGHPVLVADDRGEVVGVAAYDDFRDTRKWPGYRFTVEHTVHVRQDRWGDGVGRVLMAGLVERARAAGKRVMVAAIDGGNAESIRFHARLGFVEVGRMPAVGFKLGAWLDLVLMQLALAEGHPTPP